MLYRRSLNFELDIFYFKDPVFLTVCEPGGGGGGVYFFFWKKD